MNYDIVGTLSQPAICANSFLWGALAGIIISIFRALCVKGKISLIVADFTSTIALGGSILLFCFLYTKGVVWAYVIFCNFCGFLLSQFISLKIFSALKRFIKLKLTKKSNTN